MNSAREQRSAGDSRVRRLSVVAGVVFVAVLAACATEFTQPETFRVAGPSFMLGDDTPLSVTLSGPDYVSAAGTYQYTASVAGGSGTYRYRWLSKWCNIGASGNVDCATSYTLRSDSSATLSYRVVSTDVRNDIVVQVQDASLEGRSGADTIMVFGPKEWPEGTNTGVSFNCDLGTHLSKYPLVYRDTAYRRNPCTGAKEKYQP